MNEQPEKKSNQTLEEVCELGAAQTESGIQVLTVIGQGFTFFSSTRKQKDSILRFQIVAMLFMSAGSLILKGYILCDSIYITFLKGQNYRDGQMFSGCWRLENWRGRHEVSLQ